MNTNLDYYRVFYQVARLGSITAAARALYVNQPNVTRVIHLLEGELGCTLFERSNRGVRPTPEGELLMRHVAPAMEHLEKGRQELLSQQELHTGFVSIGASEVALRCLLLPVLRQFRQRYPGIQVRVSNNSTPLAVQALTEGLVDFSLVTTPVELPRGLELLPLLEIQELAVAGEEFWKPEAVTPEALSRMPLVSLGSSTATYRFYAAWFAGMGLPFQPQIQAATADQVLPMVASGLGVGFVPEDFLTRSGLPEVRPLSLTQEIPPRQVCLVRHAQGSLRLAARKFQELLLTP